MKTLPTSHLLTCDHSVTHEDLGVIDFFPLFNDAQLRSAETSIRIVEDFDFSVAAADHDLVELGMPQTPDHALEEQTALLVTLERSEVKLGWLLRLV